MRTMKASTKYILLACKDLCLSFSYAILAGVVFYGKILKVYDLKSKAETGDLKTKDILTLV